MKLNLKIILVGFVLIILLVSTETVLAQHDHGSGSDSHAPSLEANLPQPPHGGVLKTSGKYKIEMVTNLFLKNDQLTFYIFKGNLKILSNEDITGTITMKNETTPEHALVPKGVDHFVAQRKGGGSFECKVTFIIKGKTVSTNFVHH